MKLLLILTLASAVTIFAVPHKWDVEVVKNHNRDKIPNTMIPVQRIFITFSDEEPNGARVFQKLNEMLPKNTTVVSVYRNTIEPGNRINQKTGAKAVIGSDLATLHTLYVVTKTKVTLYKNGQYMGYMEFIGGTISGSEIFHAVDSHLWFNFGENGSISHIRMELNGTFEPVKPSPTFTTTVEGVVLWVTIKHDQTIQIRIPLVRDLNDVGTVTLHQSQPNGAHILDMLKEKLFLPKNVLLTSVRKNNKSGSLITAETPAMNTSGLLSYFYNLTKLYVETKTQVPVYINKSYAGYIEFTGKTTTGEKIWSAVEMHLQTREKISAIHSGEANGAKIEEHTTSDVDIEENLVLWAVVDSWDRTWIHVNAVKGTENKRLALLARNIANGKYVWESVRKLYGSDIAAIHKDTDHSTEILPEELESTKGSINERPTGIEMAEMKQKKSANEKLKTLHIITKGTVIVNINDTVSEKPGHILLGKYAYEDHIWNEVVGQWSWVKEMGVIKTNRETTITKDDANKFDAQQNPMKTEGLILTLQQKYVHISTENHAFYRK